MQYFTFTFTLGHVMRNDSIENLVTTGKIKGKRKRTPKNDIC